MMVSSNISYFLLLLSLVSLLALKVNAQGPTLQEFGLNLQTQQLFMAFDQGVNPTTCNVTAITFYSSMDTGSGSSYTPTSGSCQNVDFMGMPALIVSLSDTDWQAIINDPVLATSRDTTYITLTSQFIDSTGGSPNEAIVDPVQSDHYVGISSTPDELTLSSSFLDLNIGSLALDFSIAIANLDVTQVSLSSGNFTFQLTGSNGNVVSNDMPNRANISLVQNDLNALKIEFGSSINFTAWNVILQANAATSQVGNTGNNMTIQTLGGLQPDTTSPSITSVSVDMNAGILMLTFSEPIDSFTYDLSAVYLVNTPSQPFATNYTLSNTRANISQSADLLSFTLTFTNNFLTLIKADESIFIDLSNSFVYLQPESFSDFSSNLIASTGESIQVTQYTPDITRPVLISFDISLNFGTAGMTLTFNEPISVSSINGTSISVLTSLTNNVTLNQLINTSFSSFQTVVQVTFTSQQLNDIKLLVFNSNNPMNPSNMLYIALEDTACTDTSGNHVLPIPSNNPLLVTSVTHDTRFLSLVSFAPVSHPPNTFAMSFTFDEYVNPNSFNPSSLILTLTSPAAGSVVYDSFTIGQITNVNYLTITYQFNISALPSTFPIAYQLAYYTGNMTITFGSEFINDLAANIIATPSQPVLFQSNDTDPISPALQSFSIDLIQNLLNLTFTEPVLIIAPNNGFTLLSAINNGNSYTFSSINLPVGTFGMSFHITLSSTDVQALLADNGIATNTDNTFLQISQNFAVDYSGNSLNNTTPVQASIVIVSGGASSSSITPISTSSIVETSSTEITSSSIQEASTISIVRSSSLISSTETSSSLIEIISSPIEMTSSLIVMTSPLIEITSTPVEMTSLLTEMTSSMIPTSILITSTQSFEPTSTLIPTTTTQPMSTPLTTTIEPMSSTLLPTTTIEPSSTLLPTTTIEPSSTISGSSSMGPVSTPIPITITEIGINMNSGILNISLQMPAPVSLLNLVGNVVFSNGTHSVTLSGNGFSLSPLFSPISLIMISLDVSDTNLLKIHRISSTWTVTIQSNTITDTSGATNMQQMLSINGFIPDTTSPTISFSELNMGGGYIALNFSESINQNSVNLTSFYITSSLVDSPPDQYQITDAVVLAQTIDSITIILPVALLNELKFDSLIATGQQDSFFYIVTGGIADYDSNQLQSYSEQVILYNSDFISPEIQEYQLDLNAAVMTLTFSEPILTNALNTIGTSISGTVQSNVSTEIIGSFIGSSHLNTRISLSLDNSINDIKLALVGFSTAYITVPSSFATDTSFNFLSPIPNDQPLQVNVFISDTTNPSITSFTPTALSPVECLISFVFDEYVNLATVDESRLMITTTNTNGTQMYSSFSGGVWSTVGNNGSLSYAFSQNDRDQSSFGLSYLFAVNSGQISVTFDSSFVQDLAGNTISVPGTPLQYTSSGMDNTPPILQSYIVNLRTGLLLMSFSENVILQTIPGNIQFQSSANNPVTIYNLNANFYTNQSGLFGSSISIMLASNDSNTLANDTTLVNTVDDTYILLTGPLVIDYSGNAYNSPIPVQASHVVTPSSPDNPPILLESTINLNQSLLILAFNIPVNPTLTNPSLISLSNEGLSRNLESGSTVSMFNNNDTMLQISFTPSDSIVIKYNNMNAYNVSLGFNAITSTDGEGNQPQILSIAIIIPDTTSPIVNSFTLDMDTGSVIITFDEPILNSTYNASGIFLTNSGASQPNGLSLSDSIITSSINSNTVITLTIPAPKLNEIKANSSLAIDVSSTFLFFNEGSFRDISSNNLSSSSNSLLATTYIPDTTSPQLVNFTLNLNSGVLTTSFSETVGVSTINPTQITLYNTDLSNSEQVNGGSVSSNDGPVINIHLTVDTLNGVKVLINGGSSIRLAITATFIQDTNLNSVVAISSNNPLTSNQVIPDTTRPRLISVIAGNEIQRTLQMTFDEYVQSSSWNNAGLTLYLNTSTGIYTYTDFTDGSISNQISSIITYTISSDRFQSILGIRYQQAYYSGSIGVGLSSVALTDYSGNNVIDSASPVYYFSMISDLVSPQLTSFELNLDTAQLISTFSESILINQIPNNVRIQNTASSPTQSFTLTSNSYSSQGNLNGTIITITLQLQDVISIAVNDNLGTSIGNTFLYIENTLGVDYSGNFIQVSSNAVQASSVTDYSGQLNPQVTSFDLDLDSNQMTLHFSSSVNVSTLIASRITLINSTGGLPPLSMVTLSNITLLAQGEQSDFRFLLNIQDVINIKRHPLCYTSDNCYANFAQGLASNTIQLPSIGSTSIQVANLVQDVTPPRFLSFPIFDLNSGIFTIIFSEPINGSSTDFTSVTFSNSVSNPTQSVTLTEGFTSPDNVEIDFRLNRTDLNALKYRLNLCTSRVDCWVRLPSFFVSDIGNNPYLHYNTHPNDVSASYHQPTVFIPDTTPPILESFLIDMNTGRLILSFNEVVNDTLFNPSDIMLVNSSLSELSLTLDNETESLHINQGTAIQLTLTIDDLNWIKAREMYSSVSDSYLSLVSNMADVSGNTINDIIQPMRADIFIEDTTSPQLSEFNSFNLDNGSFFITFNEPVQVSSINPLGISFSSGTIGSPINYTLTGGNITAIDNHKLTIMITLSREDRIAIKLLTGLATSADNIYIYVTSLAALDIAGNQNSPIPISSAIQLNGDGFTTDTSLAELYQSELDMNTGQLKLIFTDVIRADTVMPFLINIQNVSSTSNRATYTLTQGSTASTQNSDTIYISLQSTDLNNIKANLNLATSTDTTYIAFPTTKAEDIEGRNVIGISQSNSRKVTLYIPDTTSPSLVSYAIDMDAGTLSLTMSEPVLLNSFSPTQLTVQNSINSPTSLYTLASGTVTPQTFGVVADDIVTLNIAYNDLNEIKSRTTLASTSSDTFLNISSTLFTDTNANNIVSVSAMSPSTYSGDVTLPVLSSFSLDLRNQATLILVFSEAIRFTTDLQSTVMVQNRAVNPTVTLSLTSSEQASQTGLDQVTITLSNTHSNQLLTDTDIAENSNALYISMTPGGIYDYSAGNGQSIATLTQKVNSLYRTCFNTNTYNNASLGTCESCASSCVGGCTGSLNIAGTGGCSQCAVILLNTNGNQITCLPSGSQCPTGYYTATGSFAGLTSNGRLCRPCHETCATCNGGDETSCTSCTTAFIVNSFGSLSQCTTSCNSASTNCRYCDIQCNGCTGPSNTDCVACKGTSRINSQGEDVCAPICSDDQFQSELNGNFGCTACHPQCNRCTGPSNTECIQCKNVNNTFTSSNECTATCPFGSYPDHQSKCRACDSQCNGCTGPSSMNCTTCTDQSMLQTTGEIVCVPSCPLWQDYDLSSSSCQLSTGAQLAVIVISSAVGGVLLVLAVLLACCCIFCCRKRYKIPEDVNMKEMGGGATFIRGSYLTNKTSSI